MTHVSMGWVRSYRTFSPLPSSIAAYKRSLSRKRESSPYMRNLLFPIEPACAGLRWEPFWGMAVSLCCTCPGVAPGGRYPLSLPCGARTFLIWVLSVPIRGCPPRSRIYCTSWGGKSQMSCKFFSERIYYIICLPVQLSITYTNWNLAGYRIPGHCEPEFPVIANQSADWCGNLPDRSTISQ